jgi:hypothetical protein
MPDEKTVDKAPINDNNGGQKQDDNKSTPNESNPEASAVDDFFTSVF